MDRLTTSNSYSLILRRYDGLRYNDLIEEYALQLAEQKALPSDTLLIHHARLIRYAEQVSDAFQYADLPLNPTNSEQQIQFIIKSFDTQLSILWTNISTSLETDSKLTRKSKKEEELTHPVALGYAHLSFNAWTHEIALHIFTPGQPLSTFQTEQLVACLQGVKAVLDLAISTPDRQMQSLCGHNWTRLHYVFHLAMEITLNVDSPSWNIAMVREVLQLELYIDQMCEKYDRCAAQISSGPSNSGELNWFEAISRAWKVLRASYMSELNRRGVMMQPTPLEMSPLLPMDTSDLGAFNSAFMDFANVDFMMPWYGNGEG